METEYQLDDQSAGLLDVPGGVLVQAVRCLPLASLLKAAAACHALKAASEEALRSVVEVPLLHMRGEKTVLACRWLSAVGPERLTSIHELSVQGASAVPALMELASSDKGQALLAQLRRLSIDATRSLRDENLTALLKHTPLLEALEVNSCKVTDAGLVTCASLCPAVRRITVRDCFGITDDGVAYLSLHAKQLQAATFDGCVHVTSDSVALLIERCPGLTELSLEKCVRVKDRAFAQLATSPCRSTLQILSLRQCPRFGATSSFRSCTALARLNLTGCAQVTDNELKSFLLSGGSNLHALSLNGCKCVTGAVLGPIGELCPELRQLELRGLTLADSHLQLLAAAATAPPASAADGGNGGPGGAARCMKLEGLHVVWCTRLTEQGLEPVLRAAPHLRVLEVEALYLLTDSFLPLLAELCPQLCSLNVRLCHLLGADALVALVEGLPRLRSLSLSGVMAEAETTACVHRMRTLRPSMRLLW